MMITRAAVVAEAREWLGTPYHHQARLKGVGVDCAGLVIGVARALGIVGADMDVTGYSRRPDGTSMLAHCDAWMQHVPFDALQPGDVIVLRIEDDPQHMAIAGDYVHGGLSMIHSLDRSNGRGSVIEHRLDDSFRSRLVAAYALPGVGG